MSDKRPQRSLSASELEGIDPAFIDSVTGDRLLATIEADREHIAFLMRMYNNHCVEKTALWLADAQGELEVAAQWIVDGVGQWIDDEALSDDWAHDWRSYWAYWGNQHGPDPDHRLCDICGKPATITGKSMQACNTRHHLALRGKLTDEQCRLCNQVVVCAHDLAGSPVCADCWPGDRLLADARQTWAKRWERAE